MFKKRTTSMLWAGGCFFVVLFWPLRANVVSQASVPRPGDGLYKSALTSANFGLLGVRVLESNNGKKHWNIRADFAELHRKENIAQLRLVDAQFYAASTGNVIRTRSQYGRSNVDKQDIHLDGDVSILSKKGYLFSMNSLRYLGDNHEFRSEDTVHMKGPDVEAPVLFLRGVGLNADIDHEHFFLRKNVSAQKKLKGRDWLKVRARSGEFFTDQSRAVFIGEVDSSLPKTTIESDVLEITMSPENESLLARGNVILHTRDRVGTADTASLQVNGDRIVLEGGAKVRGRDNEVTGRRITLYTDDDRVEVEQAQGRVRSQ